MKEKLKTFISYSWDSAKHMEYVKKLAIDLRADGIDVSIDQWELVPGDQLPEFMEKSIRENDFIIVICSPKYKEKSDKRFGGVGYEGDIITGELLISRKRRKFIPVFFEASWEDVAPSWLLGTYYLDMRQEIEHRGQVYQLLVTSLSNQQEAPPLLGDIFENSTQIISTGKITIPHIVGQYQDSKGTDVIFFKKKGDVIIGIYDYAHKKKTGYLVGKIEDDVYTFQWKWFDVDISGFGKMKIMNRNKLINGFYWYKGKENLIEHVGYTYVSDEMPNWIKESDFEAIYSEYIEH